MKSLSREGFRSRENEKSEKVAQNQNEGLRKGSAKEQGEQMIKATEYRHPNYVDIVVTPNNADGIVKQFIDKVNQRRAEQQEQKQIELDRTLAIQLAAEESVRHREATKQSNSDLRKHDLVQEQMNWMKDPSQKNSEVIVNMMQDSQHQQQDLQQQSEKPLLDKIDPGTLGDIINRTYELYKLYEKKDSILPPRKNDWYKLHNKFSDLTDHITTENPLTNLDVKEVLKDINKTFDNLVDSGDQDAIYWQNVFKYGNRNEKDEETLKKFSELIEKS